MWKVQRCQTIFLLILSFSGVVFALLYEGDACYHKKIGKSGTCRLLETCKQALLDLKQKIYPENCGFIKDKAIVCCVRPEEVTTTTTTTTTTTLKPDERRRVGQISQEKCKEYEALAYEEEPSPILTDNIEVDRTELCTWDPDPLIINGVKTKLGEVPHMALLKYINRERCGGSLISENFVLTAAHCITENTKPISVRLGDLDISDPNDDEHAQQIRIKKIHVHPDYKAPIQYNDIALLELEKPAKLSLYLKPICLYTKDDFSFNRALVSGWGLTEDHVFSDHLLKTTLDVFPKNACAAKFNHITKVFPRGVDYSVSVCAGSYRGANDTCGGDSGGPLQIYAKNVYCSYYIVGITSFGLRCGDVNSPAVYTKVYPYLEWIEGIVWPK